MKLTKLLPIAAIGASLLLKAPVFAEGTPHVRDDTNLLTTEEVQELDDLASSISEEYDFGVYVRVLDSYDGYSTIEECAENLYIAETLGYQETKDGVLFIITMEEREYDICAFGDRGNYAFTDYGKSVIADSAMSGLSSGDFYLAFHDYLGLSQDFLENARQGTPVDIWIPDEPEPEPPVQLTPWEKIKQRFAFIAGIPSAISLAICSALRGKNKSEEKATDARNYIARNGIHITRSQDIMINATVVRTPIVRNENRPSGGHFGGTTVNSGGFSHHSGKF